MAATVGVDGWRLLTAPDPADRVLVVAMIREAQKAEDARLAKLARMIRNEIGEAFGG